MIASWAAKTVPREPKTPSRRLKSPPRPSKEGPRAPKSGPRPPQDDPRSPLGTVLEPSWDQATTRLKSRSIFVKRPPRFGVDFGSQNDPPNDPKSTPKRVKNQDEKCITFLSLLELSWGDLGSILRPILGPKCGSRLGETAFREKYSFSKNDDFHADLRFPMFFLFF